MKTVATAARIQDDKSPTERASIRDTFPKENKNNGSHRNSTHNLDRYLINNYLQFDMLEVKWKI